MVDVSRKRATYAEYVAIANDAGEIVATAGGTIAHARLISRMTSALDHALEGRPCIVLPSDMRVRIRAADRSTYPDLVVVCGQPEQDSNDDHAVVNPTVIVEVLSDSSNDSDRTDKFAAYRRELGPYLAKTPPRSDVLAK
jgi:Uma2 family endonuclease